MSTLLSSPPETATNSSGSHDGGSADAPECLATATKAKKSRSRGRHARPGRPQTPATYRACKSAVVGAVLAAATAACLVVWSDDLMRLVMPGVGSAATATALPEVSLGDRWFPAPVNVQGLPAPSARDISASWAPVLNIPDSPGVSFEVTDQRTVRDLSTGVVTGELSGRVTVAESWGSCPGLDANFVLNSDGVFTFSTPGIDPLVSGSVECGQGRFPYEQIVSLHFTERGLLLAHTQAGQSFALHAVPEIEIERLQPTDPASEFVL